MTDELKLDAIEARVLGVLIEKELTTPEQYPMTLNGATLGANQKSNRDPVLNLLESEVNAALGKMIVKGIVGSVHPMGSRVEKFRHNAEAIYKIGKPQAALLAELMMRGPQQPGELRARVSRMSPCDTQAQLMEIMRPLLERGLVIRLEPAPGSRAESYAQTIAPTAHPLESRPAPAMKAYVAAVSAAQLAPTPSAPAIDTEAYERRIADLEFQVGKLTRQISALAWKLGEKLEP